MFDNKDAWFLTSLIILNKWSSVRAIIAVGDMLNHAILTQEEIDYTLERLMPTGYVECKKQRMTEKELADYSEYEEYVPTGYADKKYRATEKAIELTNCSAYKRAGFLVIPYHYLIVPVFRCALTSQANNEGNLNKPVTMVLYFIRSDFLSYQARFVFQPSFPHSRNRSTHSV